MKLFSLIIPKLKGIKEILMVFLKYYHIILLRLSQFKHKFQIKSYKMSSLNYKIEILPKDHMSDLNE